MINVNKKDIKQEFKKAQSEYEYKLNNPFDSDDNDDDDQLFGEPDNYKQYIEDIG